METGTTPEAARAALLGRSTARLRLLAGGVTFALVLASLALPHPAPFARTPVVVLTLAMAALIPVIRGRVEQLWHAIGPLLALGYVLGVVALTGRELSVYADLVLIVVAVSALTRRARAVVLVTVAAVAVAHLPGALNGAPPAFFTDAFVDGVVVATVALLMYHQSATLRLQAKELQRRVEETRVLLEREHEVVEQLRQAEAARTLFARNVAHEIRTPLTVVGGSIALLTHKDLDEARRQELLGALERNYDRLEELLTTIDLVHDTTTEAHVEPISAWSLVSLATAAEPDVVVRLPEAIHDLVVEVDAHMLAGAVRHLLRNGARHGGPDATVVLTVAETHGGLSITVTDDGPGWPRGDPSALTEPFAQGNRAASAPKPGIGIGLAVVTATAVAHGGTVTLSNCDDTGGAKVVLELPGCVTTPTIIDLGDEGAGRAQRGSRTKSLISRSPAHSGYSR